MQLQIQQQILYLDQQKHPSFSQHLSNLGLLRNSLDIQNFLSLEAQNLFFQVDHQLNLYSEIWPPLALSVLNNHFPDHLNQFGNLLEYQILVAKHLFVIQILQLYLRFLKCLKLIREYLKIVQPFALEI